MVHGFRTRQAQEGGQPFRGHNVRPGARAQATTRKGEEPQLQTAKQAKLSVASNTFAMPTSHKVAGTGCLSRFIEELPVRADGLESMVFHHDGLPKE